MHCVSTAPKMDIQDMTPVISGLHLLIPHVKSSIEQFESPPLRRFEYSILISLIMFMLTWASSSQAEYPA